MVPPKKSPAPCFCNRMEGEEQARIAEDAVPARAGAAAGDPEDAECLY